MANIKSIGGNPIVLGLDGLTEEAKAALGNGKLSSTSESILGTPDTAQWATRESTGSGAAIVRSVQGAAVAFNQIVNGNFESASYWAGRESAIAIADGVATIMPISDGTQRGLLQTTTPQTGTVFASHKYYIGITCKPTVQTALQLSCSGNNPTVVPSIPSGEWTRCTAMWSPSTDSVGRFYALASATLTTADTLQFKDAILVDLTQMFGSGNEPTTVAEFERMYPEAYYPYSAPTLTPVRIAGIATADAQGGELDAIEWPTQTLRAAGSVRDELTADELVTRVGVVDLGTLSWGDASEIGRVETTNKFVSDVSVTGKNNLTKPELTSDTGLTVLPYYTGGADAYRTDGSISIEYSSGQKLFIYDSDLANMTAAQVKTALSGKTIYYELATPTTTPISPALDMSYKVKHGGSESIIVPDGEISAAPVLTIAEGESAGELVMDALACIAAPDGPVATANHAVNTYLTYNGKLYKVTSAIAVGETIAPNTNVSQTTVMDELIALTA